MDPLLIEGEGNDDPAFMEGEAEGVTDAVSLAGEAEDKTNPDSGFGVGEVKESGAGTVAGVEVAAGVDPVGAGVAETRVALPAAAETCCPIPESFLYVIPEVLREDPSAALARSMMQGGKLMAEKLQTEASCPRAAIEMLAARAESR